MMKRTETQLRRKIKPKLNLLNQLISPKKKKSRKNHRINKKSPKKIQANLPSQEKRNRQTREKIKIEAKPYIRKIRR